MNDVFDRTRVLEDGARCKNIRITGVMEMKNETSEQTKHKVQKLIAEKLQLNNVNISSAFRVGKHPPQTSQNPRPIVDNFLFCKFFIL